MFLKFLTIHRVKLLWNDTIRYSNRILEIKKGYRYHLNPHRLGYV